MEKRAFSWPVSRVAALAAGAAVLTAGLAYRLNVAHACGGFFCSQANPVQQSAEEIIFVANPDDTVTAVIRINYTGPSEHFAWVLPIQGVPSKVDVSSNTAFEALRQSTQPQYSLVTTVEGTCKQDLSMSARGGFATTGAAQPPSATTNDGGVTVVDQGAVGPYDWEVIKVDPMQSDPAQAAVTWLTAHGYDVTDLGPSVLRPYLTDGLNLMAFKLTKAPNVNTGSIRPVIVTFNSKLPSIPIRPTAVAAQPDMGVLVYVLNNTQAVPKNYKALVLNEALIDWFNYQSNYRAVVTAAAKEAGGQGFVTEMAGDSKQLDGVVFAPYQQQQWMQYSLQSFADGFSAIQQASFQYRGWDGWRDAVCGAVTLPSNVTCDEFGRNPTQYQGIAQIDQAKFLKALYEGVVRPVIQTQDLLLQRPYFTRLFTTMGPEDMTADPAFDFNPDLADVSNQHQAMQLIECDSNTTYDQAPWRILLPQGGVISGKGYGSTWPIAIGGALPANFKIVELGTTGGGKVVEDNSTMILKALTGSSGSGSTGTGGQPSTQRVPIGGSADAGVAVAGRGGVPIGGSAGSGATSGGSKATASAGSGASSSGSTKKGGGCSVGAGGTGVAAHAPSLAWVAFAVSVLARRKRRSA